MRSRPRTTSTAAFAPPTNGMAFSAVSAVPRSHPFRRIAAPSVTSATAAPKNGSERPSCGPAGCRPTASPNESSSCPGRQQGLFRAGWRAQRGARTLDRGANGLTLDPATGTIVNAVHRMAAAADLCRLRALDGRGAARRYPQPPPDETAFSETVKPFLFRNCYQCHNERRTRGNLDLKQVRRRGVGGG